MSKKTTKVLLSIDDELLADIDDYWFRNRMKSRASTIRKLILASLIFAKPVEGPKKTSPKGEF